MFISSLFLAGIADFRYRNIPDWMNFLIGVCGVIFNTVSMYERIAGFILPAFPLFLIALWNPKIKGGDIKYLAALGVSVGINVLAIIMFYVLCISYVNLIIAKRNSVPLAFVSFIGYLFWRWFV